jgi:hypothetical protein
LLGVYVRGLSATSATSRALNGGQPPWNRLESLTADLWEQRSGKEHPDRAEIVAKVLAEKKAAKVGELKSMYQKRKHTYGLE